MKFKYAIFDMDGTLLDTMKYWRNSVSYYAEIHGLPKPQIDDETLNIAFDMPTYKGLEYLRQHTSEPLVHAMTPENVYEVIEYFYYNEPSPIDGVSEVLHSLKANGVKLCCASATPTRLVNMALDRADLLAFFDFIVTTDDYPKGKVSPDIFYGIAERFGCDVTEMALFEDALYSIKTAKDIGIYVIAKQDFFALSKRKDIIKNSDVYIEDYFEYNYGD
jgi:HAD superfamily hydrolase (TIGR01509 family)